MAILGVDDFKSKLVGGGARANMFKVTCNFPSYAQGDVELSSFLIKGAQMPSSVVAPVPVLFRGRQLQLAGDRTFEPWTITIINDTGFEIRNAFERWMNGISKQYDLRGCFPTNISAIDVNYDSENTIQEFTVELQVQYWESGTTS